jgi:galactose mutarotase-like enzyme
MAMTSVSACAAGARDNGQGLSVILRLGAWLTVSCFAGGLAAASRCAAETAGAQLVRLSAPGSELRAYIAPAHGADLAGLEVRHDGRWSELLYRGTDYRPTGGWTGKAPILWPAVGRNFPNPAGTGPHGDGLGWVLDGRVYPMPIHGFARDQAWRIVRRGSCDGSVFLTLALSDNDQTRSMYPFGFTLTTEYRIWRDALFIRQMVHAHRSNAEPMPFSIGNHITFTIPLLPGDDPFQTTISTPATEQVITDGSGRPTGRVVTASYAGPRLLSSMKPLTPVSLSGYAQGQEWVRLKDRSGFAITVSHSEDRRPRGTPVLFNLWGDVSQGYFAPEPWVGKQNSLATGDGIVALEPGGTFRWTIEVRVERGPAASTVSDAAALASTCLQ